MRIGIDALQLAYREFSGIENYVSNLIKEFKKLGAEKDLLIYDHPLFISPAFSRHFILPIMMNADQLEVAHFPDHILPLLPVRAKKVITVHDLAFVKYPRFFSWAKRLHKTLLSSRSVQMSDRIIVPSEATRRDLMEIYGTAGNKIEVIPHGIADIFRPQSRRPESGKRLFSFEKFILFVSTLEPRKNLRTLLTAFEQLPKEKRDLGLVICGKPGWLYKEDLERIKTLSRDGRAAYLGHVDDEKLVEIYNLAEVLVYPSFYEGFGFPPLEAMACGTPVIASRVSCLPEMLGDVACWIDPNDASQIKDAILKVIDDNIFKEKLIRQGLEQVRKFTWQAAAKRTLEVYRNVG
jgi:glycosyltransferase involved in cell wall biosynthesis